MGLKENMQRHNNNLSKYATSDFEAYRLKKEEEDIRTPFFRDIDRILYSYGFNRYIDKTQVFSFTDNNHITKRILHIEYVSKIARTIGRALGLNEDLIEAAALGHDLGHTPFGHFGESILNKISLENNEGYFNHNVQSVRLLMELEKKGKGLNLSIQVLDAIMCHNGEFVKGQYQPKSKTKEQFLEEYHKTYEDKSFTKTLIPMTLEGCVVRISDVIAYLGRDIDDACMLGKIKKEDIPKEIVEVLGIHNRDIINTIIMDIINNSLGKNYIKLSDKVYNAIVTLKEFNTNNIYLKSMSIEDQKKVTEMFYTIFNYYKDKLNNNIESSINREFINYKDESYRTNNTNERIIIDFIAGMTDNYFIKKYNNIVKEKEYEMYTYSKK